MSTDGIKNFLTPITIEILTYLLLKEDFIDLGTGYISECFEKDMTKNKEILSKLVQKYDNSSRTFTLRVKNKENLKCELKNYLNAYKADKLKIIDDNCYPYIANLFQMYEILVTYSKSGSILDSNMIRSKRSLKIRFAEMILDLYFQEKTLIEISDCNISLGLLSQGVSLKASLKLNKTPLEIYKAMLFDFYLNQSLSKSSNKFLEKIKDEDDKKRIIKIFEAYANGKESRVEIGKIVGTSEANVKKIEEKLKTFHHLSTHHQLIMKAVQENVVRLESTF